MFSLEETLHSVVVEPIPEPLAIPNKGIDEGRKQNARRLVRHEAVSTVTLFWPKLTLSNAAHRAHY